MLEIANSKKKFTPFTCVRALIKNTIRILFYLVLQHMQNLSKSERKYLICFLMKQFRTLAFEDSN